MAMGVLKLERCDRDGL